MPARGFNPDANNRYGYEAPPATSKFSTKHCVCCIAIVVVLPIFLLALLVAGVGVMQVVDDEDFFSKAPTPREEYEHLRLNHTRPHESATGNPGAMTTIDIVIDDESEATESEEETTESETTETETESEEETTESEATEKTTPKKVTPKKVTPKKTTPKKTTPKKTTPKKTTYKKEYSYLAPGTTTRNKKSLWTVYETKAQLKMTADVWGLNYD